MIEKYCQKLYEFSLFQYMKGRWSYDGVNSAVDEYNNALSNRYNFLNKGFQAMASAASKKRFKVRFR